MSSKPVEPQLGAASFSCPHCGAYAQQYFLRVFAKGYDQGKVPSVLRYDQGLYDAMKSTEDEDEKLTTLRFLERLKKHMLTHSQSGRVDCHWEMVNLAFSMCFSCGGFAIWVEDKVMYPVRSSTITAHDKMPACIRE